MKEFHGSKIPAWIRINSGLLLYLICIVLVVLLDAIFIKENGIGSPGTFYATIALLVVTGIADALVQGSLVGSAGELPARYMQAFVSGTAASGVIVSLLRIATKAALPQTPRGLRLSGNVYFGVTAAFLAFCIVAFNLVHKLPVMIYYRKDKTHRLIVNSETEPLASGRDLESEVNAPGNILTFPSAVEQPLLDKDKLTHVLKQVKWVAGSITLIYVVTLSIFPGFISEDVQSAALGNWYAVVLMTSYNVFDLIGKNLTTLYIPESINFMIGGSVGRLLFIPLFAACLHGPRIFRTEVPVFLLTSLLGISNGYFTSCLFIVGPKTVPLAEAETAGIVITVSLVLGLSIGSTVSWFWVV